MIAMIKFQIVLPISMSSLVISISSHINFTFSRKHEKSDQPSETSVSPTWIIQLRRKKFQSQLFFSYNFFHE